MLRGALHPQQHRFQLLLEEFVLLRGLQVVVGEVLEPHAVAARPGRLEVR